MGPSRNILPFISPSIYICALNDDKSYNVCDKVKLMRKVFFCFWDANTHTHKHITELAFFITVHTDFHQYYKLHWTLLSSCFYNLKWIFFFDFSKYYGENNLSRYSSLNFLNFILFEKHITNKNINAMI